MSAMVRVSVMTVAIGLALGLLAGRALADGTWLDQRLVQWNSAGMAIPTPDPDEWSVDPFCSPFGVEPVADEEWEVADAGWLIDSVDRYAGGLTIVRGYTGTDGMCRSMNYNDFVFVDGWFAGTISPVPMFARTDGSGYVTDVSNDGRRLTAEFARYSDTDPLCCPSRISTVTYRIDRTAAGPVLVVESVRTAANPR